MGYNRSIDRFPGRKDAMLFDYLSTYHYGRCIKRNDWYLKTIGINRLYRIHRGSVSVLLDNRPYVLTEGYLYLFPQNLKFELVLNEDTEVDHTFVDFFTLPAIKMDTLIQIDPAAHPTIGQAAQILLHLAGTHQTYPTMERNDYTELVESYLHNLLFLIDREFPIPKIEDPRINTVLDYIHKNYDQEISLEELLQLTNLEKNYFIRLFKSCMNITPYQYIKKYRFNIALSLLKHRCSLTEAAQKIGYADAVSFSHAFKKIYGVSPSQITKAVAQKPDAPGEPGEFLFE